jgi:hypothetical protein
MLRQRRQSWITCKFSTKSVKHGKLIGSNRCIQKYPSPFIEQFWRKFLAQAMLVVLFHNIFHAGSQVLRAFPNIVKSLENIPASQGIFFLKFHHISKMSGTKNKLKTSLRASFLGVVSCLAKCFDAQHAVHPLPNRNDEKFGVQQSPRRSYRLCETE